jgi:hypothetical protein
MPPLEGKNNASNVARGVLIDNLRFSIDYFGLWGTERLCGRVEDFC